MRNPFCFRAAGAAVAAVLSIHSALAQHKIGKRLPEPMRGEAAIAALGGELPGVAQAHGLDAQTLSTRFRLQRDLGVDRDGTLMFICEGMAVSSGSWSQSDVPNSSNSAIAVGSSDHVDARRNED